MVKPYTIDLRERVVAAVNWDGLSRQEAARRFGVAASMAPLRGWSPIGTRLMVKVPYGHWQTMTFLAALRRDRIEAPWLLDGPINGEMFLIYVIEVLVPTLTPRDIVIIDNLGTHKIIAVRKPIRKAVASIIFLPKYSPDLNPIEQVFSKFKHYLRKAQARTFVAVKTAISPILCMFTPDECKNYIINAGYNRI
jgi:transposase